MSDKEKYVEESEALLEGVKDLMDDNSHSNVVILAGNGAGLTPSTIATMSDMDKIPQVLTNEEQIANFAKKLSKQAGVDEEEITKQLRTMVQPRPQVEISQIIDHFSQIPEHYPDPYFRHNVSPAKSNKVGRNKPCPCGSGKKYKRCCIH